MSKTHFFMGEMQKRVFSLLSLMLFFKQSNNLVKKKYMLNSYYALFTKCLPDYAVLYILLIAYIV